MILNITETKKYLFIFWIILSSGVWSITFPPFVTVLLHFGIAAFMLMCLIRDGKLNRAGQLIILALLLLFSFIVNFDFHAWLSYSFIICYGIFGLYIGFYWKPQEFLDKYSNIMIIIVAVSLVMYCFRNVLADFQGGFPVVEGQTVSYTNFYVYLYCRELPDRNCAVFWEPGAYAVFIGIALYHTLCNKSKHRILKMSLFILALFTTRSTLAYTLILLALLLYFLAYRNNGLMINKIIIGIISIVIILHFLNEFGAFQSIQEKLFLGLKTNASSRARNIGQLIDLKFLLKYPIFGAGFNGYYNSEDLIENLYGQWTVAANTFTYMGALFGAPFLIFNIIGLLKLSFQNNKWSIKIVAFVFLFWLFITQNFVEKPIFYCLVFLGYSMSKSYKSKETRNHL